MRDLLTLTKHFPIQPSALGTEDYLTLPEGPA